MPDQPQLDANETEQIAVSTNYPRYQAMVVCVLAFAFGIAIDRMIDISFWFYAGTILFALSIWYSLRYVHTRDSILSVRKIMRRESLASFCLIVALMAVGAFWHHGRWNWFGSSEISLFAQDVATPAAVEAIVISEPRWMAPSKSSNEMNYEEDTVRTRVTLRVLKIRDDSFWISASGIVDLVIHAPTKHMRSGDRVRVFGRLVKSSPPTNPGQYDFQTHYRAKSKLAFLHAYYPESVEVIEPAGWGTGHLLSTLRHKLNDITWKYLEPDEAAFASAILLGNREQLASSRRELFLETGTVHLLAISGLHVGILAGSIFLFFRVGLLSRRNCLWATILFVVFYAWLVEFRPPVSRAAILIVLYCIGRLCGENNFSFNLLAIAGLIVLLINPSDLFGLGPQLSFLAVGTLTFGKDWVFWPPPTDPIKRLIANTRPWHVRTFFWMGRQLRTATLVSGLIWFVAMPLVAYRFHLVAPVALIVNPLLLIPIAWALYSGLGVLIFGWALPPVAKFCGQVCEANLGLIEWMIAGAQNCPGSHLWTSGPSLFSLILFYVGLFITAIFPLTKLHFRSVATLALLWLVFAWLVPNQIKSMHDRANSERLACTFIDVGHGTSVLIQLPNGRNLLYDGGSIGSAEYGAKNIASVLWSQGIYHLDAIVISHGDLDHFNSLPEVMQRFSVGVAYVSKQMQESDSPVVQRVFQKLDQANVRVAQVQAGDKLTVAGQPIISVLNPPHYGTGSNDNSDSVVLLLDYAGQKILLPGDLESTGLDLLVSCSKIDCDFVMAPHHGSPNSHPQEFLNWCTPEHVVISGGSQRITAAIESNFQSPNRQVHRTDRDGAVRFVVEPSESFIEHWAGDEWKRK